jgi:hypothetical protein
MTSPKGSKHRSHATHPSSHQTPGSDRDGHQKPEPHDHHSDASRVARSPRQRRIFQRQPTAEQHEESPRSLAALRVSDIRVICLYPSVLAAKLARRWIETALHSTLPHAGSHVEYFSYTVLSNNGISWEQVCKRIRPDIILMVGDGNLSLNPNLRHSLRELISMDHPNGKKPLVLFRDLEPEPTTNSRIILDYVSALTIRNNCQLNAMNGNGTPISCFRHPRLLLKTRRYHE